MNLKLLQERDLPPSDQPEFKWFPCARTTAVQIKRLKVQPALISYPKSLAREKLLELLESIPLYQELANLHKQPVQDPFPEVYATRQHTLEIRHGEVYSIESQLFQGGVRVIVPPDMPLDSYRVQRFAYEYLVQILFVESHNLLIPYAEALAQEQELSVKRIKITSPSLKWGSCSSDGTLIFSLFAMLLPNEHLRYLVLHELAHLTYLNHSDEFWYLLTNYLGSDAVTADKALEEFSRNEISLPVLF